MGKERQGEVVDVGKCDGLFVATHVKTGRGGSSDGTAHGNDKVRDGMGVGVHEAEAPIGPAMVM
jgi:hypothetical protein